MARNACVRRTAGFTLLELLLSLALTTIILGILTAAVFSIFRFLDVRRTRLEESQVARAVLRRFADDLKGTVHETTLDFSGVSGLTNPAGGSGDDPPAGGGENPPSSGSGSSGSGSSGGATGNNSSQGGSSGSEAEAETGATSSETNTLVHTKPGLYGTQYDLEIDVSRLPRIDEYSPVLLGEAATAKIPSDIKTVSYYVRTAADAGLSGHVGLMRREVDRSVTLYAIENGDETSLEANEEVLAPEVVAVEFRYYNGTEWLTEWNSEEEKGLPLAVEVAVAVAAPSAETDDAQAAAAPVDLASAAGAETTAEGYQIYRLVVPLPTAEPKTDDADASATDSSSSSESQNSEATP